MQWLWRRVAAWCDGLAAVKGRLLLDKLRSSGKGHESNKAWPVNGAWESGVEWS